MPGFDPAPYREPRGNERWILLGAFLLAVGALVAIVLEDYEPAKLAPVFMLVSYFPLIAVHELGHAAAARALGWRVEAIVVGFGREAARFEVRGVPVTIKMYPLGGWVRPVPRRLRAVRLESALVYLAGPLAEVAVVLTLAAIIGWDGLTSRTDQIGVIAAQGVCIAAGLDVFFNLLPRRIDTEHGPSFTDGLGALVSLTRSRRDFAAQVARGYEEEIEHRAALGQLEATLATCEQAYAALGDEPRLRTATRRALDRLAEEHDLTTALEGRALPASIRRR